MPLFAADVADQGFSRLLAFPGSRVSGLEIPEDLPASGRFALSDGKSDLIQTHAGMEAGLDLNPALRIGSLRLALASRFHAGPFPGRGASKP